MRLARSPEGRFSSSCLLVVRLRYANPRVARDVWLVRKSPRGWETITLPDVDGAVIASVAAFEVGDDRHALLALGGDRLDLLEESDHGWSCSRVGLPGPLRATFISGQSLYVLSVATGDDLQLQAVEEQSLRLIASLPACAEPVVASSERGFHIIGKPYPIVLDDCSFDLDGTALDRSRVLVDHTEGPNAQFAAMDASGNVSIVALSGHAPRQLELIERRGGTWVRDAIDRSDRGHEAFTLLVSGWDTGLAGTDWWNPIAAAVALSIGSLQWLVLRGVIARASRWIPATALGRVAGAAVAHAFHWDDSGALCAVTIATAILQGACLGRPRRRASWWLMGSIFATGAATVVAYHTLVRTVGLPMGVALDSVGFGISYGVITGAVLAIVVRRSNAEAWLA
ncbi:MAG: hypothetical protein U0166_04410 [Acidobacteriota bacterium]